MPGYTEPVSFAVRKKDVLFIRGDDARIADKAFRLMEFVLYDTHNRDFNTCASKHP